MAAESLLAFVFSYLLPYINHTFGTRRVFYGVQLVRGRGGVCREAVRLR